MSGGTNDEVCILCCEGASALTAIVTGTNCNTLYQFCYRDRPDPNWNTVAKQALAQYWRKDATKTHKSHAAGFTFRPVAGTNTDTTKHHSMIAHKTSSTRVPGLMTTTNAKNSFVACSTNLMGSYTTCKDCQLRKMPAHREFHGYQAVPIHIDGMVDTDYGVWDGGCPEMERNRPITCKIHRDRHRLFNFDQELEEAKIARAPTSTLFGPGYAEIGSKAHTMRAQGAAAMESFYEPKPFERNSLTCDLDMRFFASTAELKADQALALEDRTNPRSVAGIIAATRRRFDNAKGRPKPVFKKNHVQSKSAPLSWNKQPNLINDAQLAYGFQQDDQQHQPKERGPASRDEHSIFGTDSGSNVSSPAPSFGLASDSDDLNLLASLQFSPEEMTQDGPQDMTRGHEPERRLSQDMNSSGASQGSVDSTTSSVSLEPLHSLGSNLRAIYSPAVAAPARVERPTAAGRPTTGGKRLPNMPHDRRASAAAALARAGVPGTGRPRAVSYHDGEPCDCKQCIVSPVPCDCKKCVHPEPKDEDVLHGSASTTSSLAWPQQDPDQSQTSSNSSTSSFNSGYAPNTGSSHGDRSSDSSY